MIKKSTWQHLRFPFSFFLLPVFLFALSLSAYPNPARTILVFAILHFLLYPASNGYNSYFDKDEKSIGALKNPPPVSKELYNVALFLDLTAVLLGLLIGWFFVVMLLFYGLASKAYSHPSTRLKRYPIVGWIIAGFFQGFFTFVMVYIGINGILPQDSLKAIVLFAAALSSMLLWGSYPMTQIYQHEEDAKRGDRTMSLLLGITGTFYFTAIFFSIANAGFLIFYYLYFGLLYALGFQLFLLPVLIYFFRWWVLVKTDITKADFDHTMRLNLISSACMNLFFVLFYLLHWLDLA